MTIFDMKMTARILERAMNGEDERKALIAKKIYEDSKLYNEFVISYKNKTVSEYLEKELDRFDREIRKTKGSWFSRLKDKIFG